MKALEGLRAAGATVVFDDSILPDSFASPSYPCVGTVPYIRAKEPTSSSPNSVPLNTTRPTNTKKR